MDAAAAFLGLAAWLLAVGLHRLSTARVGYDLGYFTQATWLIEHGHQPLVTTRGLPLLGDHAYLVVYPLAWLLRPFPTAAGLIVVQALALAAGVWPLHALCRRLKLGKSRTALLLAAYALFPALHNVNAADVHPEALLVPGLLAAVAAAAARRWGWYAAFVAVALLNREDAGITVAGLGLLIAVTWSRRAGLLTATMAVATVLLDRFWLIPAVSGVGYVHSDQLPYGTGLLGNAVFALGHPLRVLADLVSLPNVVLVVALLGPVAFLPLRSARWLLPAVPVQLLFLLSNKPPAHTIDYQYTAQAIPFVFVATAYALHRLGAVDLPRGPILLLGMAATCGYLSLSLDSWLPDHDIWSAPGPRAAAIRALTADVPPKASVAASPPMWTYLATRTQLYSYPAPAQYVVIETDNPVLADHPLPAACIIVRRQDLVVLARC